MKVRRSMLIVPANVPEFVEKSRNVEADIVYLDLQDAVAKDDTAKRQAREAAVAVIQKGGFKCREVSVRVNSPASPWFIDDVTAVVKAGADSVRLTHAYGLADVLFAERVVLAAADGREVDVLLSLDMPQTVVELEDIARYATLVNSLWLSSGDFTLEMGSLNLGPHRVPDDDWLIYTRSKMITIGRAKGWNVGDIVRTPGDPNDVESLKAAMRKSRAFGFDGTSVLYPRHIAIANEVYGVSTEELAWARDLVQQWESQDAGLNWDKGFRIVNGRQLYSPSYEYARRVIDYAAVLAGDPEKTEAYLKYGLASSEYLTERRATPIRSSDAPAS